MSTMEDSKEAKTCLAEFDKTRRLVLRLYPWGFATKRTVLAPDPEQPPFEYAYRHQLPSDFIRVVELYDYDGEHRVEGFGLLCDADTINLRYVWDIEDLGTADPLFIEAFEWYLAYVISRYLVESETVRQEALNGFKQILSSAKFIQSTEHSQRNLEADDLILAHRRGGRFVRDPRTH